jgi:hypothetical protein
LRSERKKKESKQLSTIIVRDKSLFFGLLTVLFTKAADNIIISFFAIFFLMACAKCCYAACTPPDRCVALIID